jgi:hypothetical protein
MRCHPYNYLRCPPSETFRIVYSGESLCDDFTWIDSLIIWNPKFEIELRGVWEIWNNLDKCSYLKWEYFSAQRLRRIGLIRTKFGSSTINFRKSYKGETCLILFQYFIRHCFIWRPSDSTVSKDAGIEPRIVATSILAVRRSIHRKSARWTKVFSKVRTSFYIYDIPTTKISIWKEQFL